MPQYKVSASASTPAGATTRKGRCIAATTKAALLKLFLRYPQLEDAQNLSVAVFLDDEEDLS